MRQLHELQQQVTRLSEQLGRSQETHHPHTRSGLLTTNLAGSTSTLPVTLNQVSRLESSILWKPLFSKTESSTIADTQPATENAGNQVAMNTGDAGDTCNPREHKSSAAGFQFVRGLRIPARPPSPRVSSAVAAATRSKSSNLTGGIQTCGTTHLRETITYK